MAKRITQAARKARADAQRKAREQQEGGDQGEQDQGEGANVLGTAEGMHPSDLRPPTPDKLKAPGEKRPTAREGLKPIGMEKAHPTAAARPGKTSGQEGSLAPNALTDEEVQEARDKRAARQKSMRVEATRLGYYDHTRRRIGDVFDIRGEEDFSENWMRSVDGKTAKRTTKSQEALDRETSDIKQLKGQAGRPGMHTEGGTRDDVRQGTDNPLGEG